MTTQSQTLPAPAEEFPAPSLRSTVFYGCATMAAFGFGLLGWTFFANLDSAVVAHGVLVADSQRKTVQHLEGGILRELTVREGDKVAAGQVLARLDATQADAQLNQLLTQLAGQQARLARLRAEQKSERHFSFPVELDDKRDNAAIGDLLDGQTRLFEARWRAYDSASLVIQKRIEQFREEIASAEAQYTATTRRLALSEEELASVQQLVERGFERRPRLLDLQRAVADLRGRQGEYRATAARNRQAIAGAQIEIANLGDTRQSDIAKEMQEASALAADLADRIRSADDVRGRRTVVAPQGGVVADLRFVTMGGVIGPGQPIMDIVPVDDELIVEAKARPADVKGLTPGQTSQVRFSGYKAAMSPTVEATLSHISPDMLREERTGEPYFTVRAKLSREAMKHWPMVRLYPGMPAELMIVTGERRAIDYLLSPLLDRVRHAGHED